MLDMFLWFCKPESVLEGPISQCGLLSEFDDRVLDNHDISTLEKYFTTDAWMYITQRGIKLKTNRLYMILLLLYSASDEGWLEMCRMSRHYYHGKHDSVW